MPEWIPINFDLLKNPLNWFIVLFMFILAVIPLALLSERFKIHGPSVFTNNPPA